MGRPRKQRNSTRANPKKRSGARSGPTRGGRRGVTITSMSPVGNISGSRPTVQATVQDSAATLSPSDISVYLDGEQVRDFQYRRTTGSLSFTPKKLPSGAHTVEISAAGGSGNARKSFTFVVS